TGFSIGTPATRADTMKKLKDVGYIQQQQKNLVCTELGKKLVETFPIHDLFDLEFTGRLEKTLSDIEKRSMDKQEFLSFVLDFIRKLVDVMKGDWDVIINQLRTAKIWIDLDGKCPQCGNAMIEGK